MTERSRFKEKEPNRVFIVCICWIFVLAALLLNSAAPLRAQEVTAGFTGTVTDPSGAPIPEATVTAQDTLRAVPYTTKTNYVGVFDLPRLPVSTFDLTVEAKGFATAVRRGITLEMNQKARVDFQLQMGAVTQEIEVTAAPPLLQTDTMQVGTVITGKINEDLPLATRNYIELTLLAPGTTNPNPSSMTSGLTTASGGRPYVNGNREQSDNFMLDGIDNNQVSDNLVGYTPSVDAIQEFNMISNNAPAEFGNFQGGIVSASIKSGTNQFHGDGFEFLRNDVLNAAQWSDNIYNSPKAKSRWNMFGGTIGGPIKKDKLFFFGDYQGERFDFPATVGPFNVFTNKERAGDFSEVCSSFDSTGKCTSGIQLYDPTHVDASGNRALIPYNNLAAAGLTEDPVAKNLFSSSTLYPAPIGPGLKDNQLNANHSEDIGDQFDVKIDANITEKDRIFGRASWSRLNNPTTSSFPLDYNDNTFSYSPTKSLGLDWTRTISPALVNEVRVGGNYVKANTGGLDKGLGNVATQLGIADANTRGPGLPSLQGFTYATGIGNANVGTQELFPSSVLQAEDTLVITHGRHVFHTGFQFFRQRIDAFYAGNYGRSGIINFDGQWTAGPLNNATASKTVGFPEADFWLGLPDTVERGVDTGTWGQRSSVLAAYVQDDWRATDQLTLNIGLRYETHTPWGEVHNRQANFGTITGTEYFAGQSGCPWSNCNALYNSYNGGFDFQPRIGFAWTPSALNKKAVIRGAYTTSSYLEGTGTNLRLTLNPPFNLEHSAIYDSLTFPTSTTDQGFSIFAPTPTSTTAPVDFAGAVIRLWNPDIKPSLAQQWNFSTEYQFPRDTVLTLGYLGQHATHLMNPMPYFQRRLVGEAGCTAADAVILSGGTIPTCQSPYLSGNPAMGTNSNPIISQISGTESNANMVYHALQVTLRKRFSQGLQYQVAYTYSKCLTNSIGYYGSWGGQVIPAAAYWQNLYNGTSEWAPCESDVTNLLSSYAVYELPFGHKMHFGSNWNPVANAVLGNWQVSGILQLRGGFPSTVSATDASGTNSRSPRADCLGPPTYPDTPVSTGGIQWVSPDSYGPELPGAFGTCSVDGFRGPGLRTFDLSVQKSFPISESKSVQFRSEFINLTNTPILNAPSAGIGAGFGQITSSQGSRNIQFSLKIYY